MEAAGRTLLPGWLALLVVVGGCAEAPTRALPATMAGTNSEQAAPVRETGMTKLESHRWKDRVLVVFAPAEGDERLGEQRRIVQAEADGFSERDLVVLEVVGLGEQGLRQRFDVGAEDFVVLLIGKDGGEKLRSETPIGGSVLYPVIDAMPMRRAEMGRRR